AEGEYVTGFTTVEQYRPSSLDGSRQTLSVSQNFGFNQPVTCVLAGDARRPTCSVAHIHVGVSALQELDEPAAWSIEEGADEGEVVLFGHILLAVDVRVASKWEPGGAGDAKLAELFGAIALGSEDESVVAGQYLVGFEVEVRVDGPPGGGVQVGREGEAETV